MMVPSRVAKELSNSPSYAGQQRAILQLPGVPELYSTTVTTGVIASRLPVNIGNITGFSSRFGTTFEEYRILAATFKITCVSASTGVSKFWFEEKDVLSTPTSNESQEKTHIVLPNTNASSKSSKTMRWRARDLLDLEYTDINTTVSPVSLSIYTDNTFYGSPSTVTALWLVEFVATVEFRGLSST